MKVSLPDDSELELDDGANGADAAAAIGAGLAKAALAIKVDGELRDLSAPLAGGETIEIVTDRSPEALELIRHDAAHVLAESVLDLWPDAKISIGPPIDSGFYYDIEFPDGGPGEEDLARIEERMAEHVKADEHFERRDLPAKEAIELFRDQGQDYKVELIEDLIRDEGAETVSLYRNGPFEDLCRGPHGPSTGRIGAFKLTSLAGAYWRGDETRQMLTRIYGTAFLNRKDLEQHLERLEQARERDHRKLGPELDLFQFRPEAPGMPFWLPHGTVLLKLIEAEVRKQLDAGGYSEIKTPQVLDVELWHRSGHWDNYKENMFFTAPTEREGRGEEPEYALKPMNCPGACLVFASRPALVPGAAAAPRRVRARLPLRAGGSSPRPAAGPRLHPRRRDTSTARSTRSPTRWTRSAPPSTSSIERFGFDDVRVELSTRPEKSIGTDEQWQRAEHGLREALARQGREYDVSPGEGTFYGPKIDFHITDALGRSWQCGTCQLDFQMPERFELTYTGADNAEHRPVMIHRALLGSMERFVGILIEHYGGRFPLWLAPVQAVVLPVADRHNERAAEVAVRLRGNGLRAQVDERTESVGRKIRDAELSKAPYMLVVGDKEAESETVSVRHHGDGDLGAIGIDALIERMNEEAGE